MRYLGLGLLLLAALTVSACGDASEEGSTTRTVTVVATRATAAPRDTVAASPTVTSEHVPPSPTATSPSPTASATPHATSPSPTATATPHVGAQAQVTRVVDGDTIEVLMAGTTYKVRYIGVDTPETVDPHRPVGCYGQEASERNRQLVEGKTVELEKDVSETDDFGRLLRYVWVDGEMVNATLVREGYALASTYPPDVKHQELFASLQREAIAAGRGLWGPACASPTTASAIPGTCDFSSTDQPAIKGNISQTFGREDIPRSRRGFLREDGGQRSGGRALVLHRAGSGRRRLAAVEALAERTTACRASTSFANAQTEAFSRLG